MRGFVVLLGSAVRFEANKKQPMAMRVCSAKIVPFVQQWQQKGSALNRLAPVGYIEQVYVESPLPLMEFSIQSTWDSDPVNHEPIRVRFSPGQGGLKIEVFGPFFNDPAAPAGPPSQAFPGLWDYEVVESFFLDSTTENYLEVELCPHGQHLILLLSGVGQAFQQQLPMVFNATITGDRWMGEALLPWSYLPPKVNKMNSYAIHGSGEKRTYEALYSIPKEEIVEGQEPNFHRLEYFQNFRLQSIMGEDWVQPESDLWKGKP